MISSVPTTSTAVQQREKLVESTTNRHVFGSSPEGSEMVLLFASVADVMCIGHGKQLSECLQAR